MAVETICKTIVAIKTAQIMLFLTCNYTETAPCCFIVKSGSSCQQCITCHISSQHWPHDFSVWRLVAARGVYIYVIDSTIASAWRRKQEGRALGHAQNIRHFGSQLWLPITGGILACYSYYLLNHIIIFSATIFYVEMRKLKYLLFEGGSAVVPNIKITSMWLTSVLYTTI